MRRSTEAPVDLQCKSIIDPGIFNLQRLPALENGAVPQEHEQAPQWLTVARLYLERC
jgi:hypothetical protein